MTPTTYTEPQLADLDEQRPLLLVASLTGHVLRLSEGCREALGYEASELSGLSWESLLHPADVESGRAWGLSTLRGEHAPPLLARMRHRSGRYRVFEWTALGIPETELFFAAGRPTDSTLGPATGEISYSGIELDERGRRLSVEGNELDLTATEFDLLTLLLRHRGTVVRADTIAREIWGYKSAGSRNYLQAHVSRLRNKLRRAGLPDLIKTVRSVGYVIR